MALSAPTITGIQNNFNVFRVQGYVTPSGSTPAAPTGDTINLAGVVASNSLPIHVELYEMPATGTAAWGGNFVYAAGTTQANGQVQLFTSGGTQVSSTSYSSLGVAKIYFEAEFPKFV